MRKRLAVLAASAIAASLAVAGPASAHTLNFSSVSATQSLVQVGGNQFAFAISTDDGDAAAANNQEFYATQYQQVVSIAGKGNAAAQNIGHYYHH